MLYFPSGKKYLVTGALNYYKGKHQDYTLNMIGSIPVKKPSYSSTAYGGIQVAKGGSLFKDAKISGSIKSMCFTGKRSDDVIFFDSCLCSGLVMSQNNVANFGVMFYDTGLRGLSLITSNTFLTVFYFSKNSKTSSGVTDSTIAFNYINGGEEKNDNTCFEWSYYNGSLITNNFIDYYRTIYYPVANKKQTFVGPVSSNNHYQVFRYFYAASNYITSMNIYSAADAFNWNNPNKLEKLKEYEPYTYKGKDGITYEIPPYIAICKGSWKTTIKAAKIESNISSLVYVESSLTEYKDNVFDVEFAGCNPVSSGLINYRQGSLRPFCNQGSYMNNSMSICGTIESVEELPSWSIGWTGSVNGRKVFYNGKIYTAVNIFENNEWKSVWRSE